MRVREDAILGCLLGAAVGYAIGFPCDRLTREKQRRLFPEVDAPPLPDARPTIPAGADQAVMAARALVLSGGEPAAFVAALAHEMRAWLLALAAGADSATRKALLRLTAGIPAHRSGVRSAGSTPALRSAVIGVCWGHEPPEMCALVRASTRLTHTHPVAEAGALAVAYAAFLASQGETVMPGDSCASLDGLLGPEGAELRALLEQAADSAAASEPTDVFADRIGPPGGVRDSVQHAVPVALQAWLRYPGDCRAAILSVVRCGGVTATTAALAGAIAGAGVGASGIPGDWLDRVDLGPFGLEWLADLSRRLADPPAWSEPLPRWPFAPRVARSLTFTLRALSDRLRRRLPRRQPQLAPSGPRKRRSAAAGASAMPIEIPLGLPARVFASPMPFSRYDPEGQILAYFREQGVSVVVLLASQAECLARSGLDLGALYLADGMDVIPLPIEDFGVPPVEALVEVVDAALAHAHAGRSVAVHCWAGIGRTGLFLACLVHRSLGLPADEAIEWVRGFIPGAVQTDEQEDVVRQACDWWAQRRGQSLG